MGIIGSDYGQFNTISGVAVDGSGNVYVADAGNYRIQKFTPDGIFITAWGSKGSEDGQFLSINGFCRGWIRKCLRGGCR